MLSAMVEGTWQPSPGELPNWLDWHETGDFLTQAGDRTAERGSGLLGGLFLDPPLGVSPAGWGFCGSLTHAEVVQPRDELGAVLSTDAIAAAKAERNGDDWRGQGDPVDVPSGRVYFSLAAVPDGCDVAVRLG